MKTVMITRQGINTEALDEALHRVFGTDFKGLSTDSDRVCVHLADNADAGQVQVAEQMVLGHDPAALNLARQERLAHQEMLEQARYENAIALELTAYSGLAIEIQVLAQKIAWLEQEIRGLRGLI